MEIIGRQLLWPYRYDDDRDCVVIIVTVITY